jgi:hypothetical protein
VPSSVGVDFVCGLVGFQCESDASELKYELDNIDNKRW